MSSGFVSENELAEKRRIRQEEWEKVRQPDQPVEAPEEVYDHRSLFERLEEQKQKKDYEYEEAHRLKHMIKGLDDDEVEFLDLVDRSKMAEEMKKNIEEARELREFRSAVATLAEQSLDERIQQEVRPRMVEKQNPGTGRTSQTKLLAGAVVKKRSHDSPQENTKRLCTESEGDGDTGTKLKSAQVSSTSSLQCIGILPGLGSYPDSSDSDNSSDSDIVISAKPAFDLLGRKLSSISKISSATQ